MENTRIGPFLIGRRLGTNRRQKVFRAKQTEQGIDVALKFIGIPEDKVRTKAIEKIKLEFEVLKQLEHVNLAKILGAGIEENQIFVATELIKGESLSALLSRRGRFAVDQVVDIGKQVAHLLDYLHGQQILHSKLTPDKIIVDKTGLVKITDLRLNRSKKRRWDASRKRELDIAAYMAPEQFVDGATEKSDIYSLGVILYEMLSGKLPFPPDTMSRMAQRKQKIQAPPVTSHLINCPAWIDKIVGQMIDPDPRKRPHTAKAVGLSLAELNKMERNKKSSVSQMSGKFNPLTAGSDKTEAKRLLGKKNKRKFDVSVLQSTPAMVFGLLMVLLIIVVGVWPKSSQQNFETAQSLMQSNEASDWRQARGLLKKILDKGPDSPLYADAEKLYFESRKKTLIKQAKRGRITGLHSDNSRSFIRAYQSFVAGDITLAAESYSQLITDVALDGDERHVHLLSKEQLGELVDSWKIPVAIDPLNQLVDWLEKDILSNKLKSKLIDRVLNTEALQTEEFRTALNRLNAIDIVSQTDNMGNKGSSEGQ